MTHSGKFVLRIDPGLHEALARRAQDAGESLNQLCSRLLKEGLRQAASKPPWLAQAQSALPYLKKRFGKNLLAAAVFGSQIQGKATAHSDLDLLVVLNKSLPIRRELYQWWEETLPKSQGPETNPHFVSLPESISERSGFWLEVALSSEILYEKEKALSRWLTRLRQLIDEGEVTRQWSNGHPYWRLLKRKAS